MALLLASSLESVSTMLVPAGVCVSRPGVEEVNSILQLVCSWRSLLMIPLTSAYAVRLVNKSLSHIPQVIFKLLLLRCI